VLTLAALLLAFFVLPPPWGAVGVAVAALVDVAETAVFLRWTKRRRATVGVETLVGRRAVAIGALAPRGQVKLDGELWDATSAQPVARGETVVVVAIDGLTLLVAREQP
jgi:membrane-bound serine protease (ClpP class)